MWKMGARYQYRVAPNKCESKIKKKKEGSFYRGRDLSLVEGWLDGQK